MAQAEALPILQGAAAAAAVLVVSKTKVHPEAALLTKDLQAATEVDNQATATAAAVVALAQ